MGRMVGKDSMTSNPKSSFPRKVSISDGGVGGGSFEDPKSKSKFFMKRSKLGEGLVAFSDSNSKTLGLTEPGF